MSIAAVLGSHLFGNVFDTMARAGRGRLRIRRGRIGSHQLLILQRVSRCSACYMRGLEVVSLCCRVCVQLSETACRKARPPSDEPRRLRVVQVAGLRLWRAGIVRGGRGRFMGNGRSTVAALSGVRDLAGWGVDAPSCRVYKTALRRRPGRARALSGGDACFGSGMRATRPRPSRSSIRARPRRALDVKHSGRNHEP